MTEKQLNEISLRLKALEKKVHELEEELYQVKVKAYWGGDDPRSHSPYDLSNIKRRR